VVSVRRFFYLNSEMGTMTKRSRTYEKLLESSMN
jgi:hypothetical protein